MPVHHRRVVPRHLPQILSHDSASYPGNLILKQVRSGEIMTILNPNPNANLLVGANYSIWYGHSNLWRHDLRFLYALPSHAPTANEPAHDAPCY